MMAADEFDALDSDLQGRVLVEASAGTGKTWTLCVLYLRLLLERRLQVPQILVVTFTNAAVAELRDRIRKRIVALAQRLRGTEGGDTVDEALIARVRALHGETEAQIAQRVELALHSFDEASVFTIHGFCHRALAESAFSSGQPLQFEQMEDDAELRLQVVRDFWRRHLASPQADPALARRLLARNTSPQALSDQLKRRIAKPLAHLRWPEDADAAPELPTLRDAHARARKCWQQERESIVAIVEGAIGQLNGNMYKPARVAKSIEAWDRLLASEDALFALQDEDVLALFGATKLQPKKNQAPLPKHDFFFLADTLLQHRQRVAGLLELRRIALLRQLLDEGPRDLRALKTEQRAIGYDDMLFNLHQQLAHDASGRLAAALRQRFAAALIDEFQDTDPLQFAIFDRIYRGHDEPLVLVGDPKQAIYSFRSADLHTYLAARASAGRHGTLRRNQRSTPALIDALNRLFGAQPDAFLQPGLHYAAVSAGEKPRAPLHDETGAARAALQLWQLPHDGVLAKADALRSAAAACAAEIVRLLAAARRGEVRLGDRPLAASDIAVLVRTHRQGVLMRQTLAACGVGTIELSRTQLFATDDAEQLQVLLAALAEPKREGLLRAALATELMGWDAPAIDALGANDAALQRQLQRFATWHEAWLKRGVAWLLRQWMRDDGVAARLLARSDGERRMTNLLHLAECLNEAEPEHRAPEALLRWLALQRSELRGDDALQLRLESDRDLVKVVTIHRCKGLEFPFVFCPLLFDGSLGPPGALSDGIEYRDADGALTIDFRALDTTQRQSHVEAQTRARRAEQMRLIYVALTRAVHRCHLVVGPYTTHAGSLKQCLGAVLNHLVGACSLDADATDAASRLIDAWRALGSDTLSVTALPAPVSQRLPPLLPRAEQLAAREPPSFIAPGWTIGSYSALVHGARHETAALDHDQRARHAADANAASSLPAHDIVHFPRGPAAGDCLHALLERVDFGNTAQWPKWVQRTLAEHAPALPTDERSTDRPAMLLSMLGDVLNTTLPLHGTSPARLSEVPRRRSELEFYLPVQRLQSAALVALLARHGRAAPALGARSLAGYLRGFIDTVFEHGGRWHLLDWKSNHLGSTPTGYAPTALKPLVDAQGYALQALLYTLALHRWLGQRLADYDYERHVGSVLVLFVRGVRPDWRDADGAACGVSELRPSRALVEELSALFEGVETTA